MPLLVLATGGTGGHIYPALSLAEEWKNRGEIPFVFTDPRGAPYITRYNPNLPCMTLQLVAPLGSVANKFRAGISLVKATVVAFTKLKTLKKNHPKIVTVAFGGYPSAPTVVASLLLGIPYILQEQNAILGRANKIMARFARNVALGFPSTHAVSNKYIVTGNPVRPKIAAIGNIPYVPPQEGEPIRILVLGGSQGAKVFSQVVPDALQLLPEHLQKRLKVDLQVRPEYQTETEDRTKDLVAEVNIQPFFEDVPDRLQAAHLIICRAGASTISEILATRRPAIFVPYPEAMDDHQTANANAAMDMGASAGVKSWLMPEHTLNAKSLAVKLIEIFGSKTASTTTKAANRKNPNRIPAASRAVVSTAGTTATARLADLVQNAA